MWSRSELKQRAKDILKKTYWKAFLVSIVISMATNGSGGSVSGSRIKYKDIQSAYREGSNWYGQIIGNRGSFIFRNKPYIGGFPFVGVVVAIIAIVAIVFALGIRILLWYNLEVGGRRYFIYASQGDVNMSYLGYGFNKERYIDIIKSMIWKDIINFLWYLLLFIPGVVKSYAYSMVPYILADNPNIGYKRALELSTQMTDGEKLDMWILDLSFLGWYLLGIIPLGLGIFFVKPYDDTTHAELYLVLRQKAIENGICDYRELNLIRQIKEDTEIF